MVSFFKQTTTTLGLAGVLFSVPVLCFGQQSSIPYRMDERNARITVRAQFQDANQLLIRLSGPSDWQGDAMLRAALDQAKESYRDFRDSFQEQLSTKSIMVFIPSDQDYESVRIREHIEGKQEFVRQNGAYHSLKRGVDTIQVHYILGADSLPAVGTDDRPSIQEAQLTFLLKNLEDISAFSIDSLLPLSLEIDRLLQDRRLQRRGVVLNFETSELSKASRVSFERPQSFFRNLGTSMSFGVEFMNGRTATTLDADYGYIWRKRSSRSVFLSLHFSAFLFPKWDFGQSSAYWATGLEWGVANTLSGALTQKSSLGFGYFFGGTPRQPADRLSNMFRLYFSYPLGSNLNVGMDFMTNFRVSQAAVREGRNASMFGVFMKFSFL